MTTKKDLEKVLLKGFEGREGDLSDFDRRVILQALVEAYNLGVKDSLDNISKTSRVFDLIDKLKIVD